MSNYFNNNYTQQPAQEQNYENDFLGGIFLIYPTENIEQGTIPNFTSNVADQSNYQGVEPSNYYQQQRQPSTIPNFTSNVADQSNYQGVEPSNYYQQQRQPSYLFDNYNPSGTTSYEQTRPFYNFLGDNSSTREERVRDSYGRNDYSTWEDDNSANTSHIIPESTEIESDGDVEETDDWGPAIPSDPPTGEDYTDSSDFLYSDAESQELRRSDTMLLVTGRSERHHPVEALNDIELFDQLGSEKKQLGPEDELAENIVFRSKEALKFVINDWAIKKNVLLKSSQSSNSRLVMTCQGSGCEWRLYARPDTNSTAWKIITNKTPHTCRRKPGDRKHDQLTASLIAACVRQHLKNDLSLSVENIRMIINTRYPGVEATYNKLWRGRERAIEQLFGTWEGSYTLLPQILEAISRSCPGTKYTIIKQDTTDDHVKLFKSAAWAYGPCIEAFKYMRPVITIDAGFLSGRYRGKLLMVCGYDAENKLLPLAFGLVDEENLDNWGWFMHWVRREVICSNRKICVISDRHKGIKAIFDRSYLGWSEQLGEAVHRYCMQHVAENLYKVAGQSGSKEDKLKDDFKCRLANKKKQRRFIEKMRILKKSNRKAYDFLKKVGKKLENDPREAPNFAKWAQTYDGGHRYGIMTSNGSEALNNLFRVERRLPVVAIVEGTWYKCAKWFDRRKMLAIGLQRAGKRWPNNIEDLLAKRDEKASRMTTIPLGTDRGEYEVQVCGERLEGGNYGPVKYTVMLSDGERTRDDPQLPEPYCSCDCSKPQLTGLPCSHVIAVCQHRNFDVYSFIDTRYSTENLINSWSGQFHSYGDQQFWPPYEGKIIPDKNMINRGRRKKVRSTMVMDKMEGRKRGHQKSRTNPRKKKQQQTTNTREPLPMEVLQSGRHTSRPPSPPRNMSTSLPDMNIPTRGFVESARYSTSYCPREMSTSTRHDTQSGRHSIDVPSIPIERRHVNLSSDVIQSKKDSFGGRILKYFGRRKKK